MKLLIIAFFIVVLGLSRLVRARPRIRSFHVQAPLPSSFEMIR